MDQGERQSFIVIKKRKKEMINIIFFVPLHANNPRYNDFETPSKPFPSVQFYIWFPARFRNVSVQFSRPVTYFFTARKPSMESWEVFLGVKSANGKVSPRGIGGELRNRANFRGMPIVLHSVTR